MKITFPACFFQHNKLKEIYYKSFIVKNSQEKFGHDFQRNFPLIEIAQDISMMNIQWGSSSKTVTRLLGNPRFATKPVGDAAADILFFKQQIAEEKAIIQCHFLKDQFYYSRVDFVTSLSRENKKVQEMVRQKYDLEDKKYVGNLVIADACGNKLIIEDNVYLQLHYITGKPALVRKIYESGKTAEIKHRDKQAIIDAM
jgi:hypothetical protein